MTTTNTSTTLRPSESRKKYARQNRMLRIALAVLILLAFALLYRRTSTYRRVIYDYQALTETTDPQEQEALRADIERKVGRANTPWYSLDKAPRYLHFWDDYNVYSFNQINRVLYDMGSE